jgi:phospholipase/carboxylesterase
METTKRQVEDWVVRVHAPDGPGLHPVLMLLHGWTGDEESMWVFARRLPKHYYMIAPRGTDSTPLGGYGWHPYRSDSWPWVDDFKPAIESLLGILHEENFPGADFSAPAWVGFSQGAAMIYSLAMLFPKKVSLLAGLSGFLPQGAEALGRNRPLMGKSVFVTHGTKDELVDVERARSAVKLLEEAGANVTYCEEDVGHKLSAPCFNSLEKFFEKHAQRDPDEE